MLEQRGKKQHKASKNCKILLRKVHLSQDRFYCKESTNRIGKLGYLDEIQTTDDIHCSKKYKTKNVHCEQKQKNKVKRM